MDGVGEVVFAQRETGAVLADGSFLSTAEVIGVAGAFEGMSGLITYTSDPGSGPRPDHRHSSRSPCAVHPMPNRVERRARNDSAPSAAHRRSRGPVHTNTPARVRMRRRPPLKRAITAVANSVRCSGVANSPGGNERP